MKRILVIGLMMALLVTAVGCSSASSEVSEQQDVEVVTEVDESVEVEVVTHQNRDEEKQGPPDVFGKVSRIVGNEVTVQLIEMPEISGDTEGTGANGQSARPEGGSKQEPKFTGETKQIIIPVGVPIGARTREGQEVLDLSDIVSGSMIMVWTDESGEPNMVQLMGAR